MNLTGKGINKFNAIPKISKQPESCAVPIGDYAEYKISTVGKNIKYQWQYSVDNGTTWKKVLINGYNTDTIKIKASDFKDGRLYRCQVKNGTGTVYSKSAKITIN